MEADRQKNAIEMIGASKKINANIFKTTNCYLYQFYGKSR